MTLSEFCRTKEKDNDDMVEIYTPQTISKLAWSYQLTQSKYIEHSKPSLKIDKIFEKSLSAYKNKKELSKTNNRKLM